MDAITEEGAWEQVLDRVNFSAEKKQKKKWQIDFEEQKENHMSWKWTEMAQYASGDQECEVAGDNQGTKGGWNKLLE